MEKFKEYNQEQGIFRTIIPGELLEVDHPARIIDRVVERLDLEELYSEYSEEGCPAYHPKMMLKVLFYSYMTGMMSCRGMWDNLKYRADYIFLSGDQVPDFRTINRFRHTARQSLKKLFTQIVMICVELDLVDFQYLAIDGQKIQANANYRKSTNKKRYTRTVKKVQEGMEKLLSEEIHDDFTEDHRNKKLSTLQKQKEILDEYQQIIEAMDESDTINLTDNEAKMMNHKNGTKLPSYNHQSAVDGKNGITVAVQTTTEAFDHGHHLLPLVDQAKENTGGQFQRVMADSGFCDFERLIETQNREEEYYLPDRDYQKKYNKNHLFTQQQFSQNERGHWMCPAGREMKSKGMITRKDGVSISLFMGQGCENCELKPKCTKGKNRQIGIDARVQYRQRMRERLQTDRGRLIYSKRQAIVESPHGHDQKNIGWKQHHLRGVKSAACEFILIRIGSNLGKIVRYGTNSLGKMVPQFS